MKTNPARNPTRMEMTAVLTQAMDRVFSEYWPPPDVSKDPRKESNEYFFVRLQDYLFCLNCPNDLLSSGDDNTSLGLINSRSSPLESAL